MPEKKRKLYKSTGIIISGTKRSDVLDVISKKVQFDRFDAEGLCLSASGLQWFLRHARGLPPAPFGKLGARLDGIELGACYTDKVSQAGTQGSCGSIKELERCVGMYIQLGQCMPRCQQEDEVKNRGVVWFGKKSFQAGDGALFKFNRYTTPRVTRLNRPPGVSLRGHVLQVASFQ